MSLFSIITDTACDMPADLAKQLDITAVPLKAIIAGKSIDFTLDPIDIGDLKFYDLVRNGVEIKTSAPSLDDSLKYFKAELNKGKDVLYIGFSSALSASTNVAMMAAEELSEQYPERKILVVDSKCASMGQALLVYYTVQKQRKGATIEETCEYAESLKHKVSHWFTLDDLYHLKKGGRISATKAVVGSLLNIKPVMKVSPEGKLVPACNARGKKLAIAKLVEQMEQFYYPDHNDIIFISNADCLEDANLLARSITKNFGITNFVISDIGPVIGAHTGPGTLALFYIGDGK